MYTVISKKDNIIPHFENIQAIQDSLPYLKSIEQYNPLYAGGYALALLVAPRESGNPTRLLEGSYSDIDIWCKNSESFISIKDELSLLSFGEGGKVLETENAFTFIFPNLSSIQLIKHIVKDEVDLLDIFDFVNCAVAFNPLKSKFTFHKEMFSTHKKRILEKFHLQVTLDNFDVGRLIIQVSRVKKYCERWNYTLSDDMFKLLWELYLIAPNTKANITTSYRSANYTNNVHIEGNIWKSISGLIVDHPLFKTVYDTANAFPS